MIVILTNGTHCVQKSPLNILYYLWGFLYQQIFSCNEINSVKVTVETS